MKAAVWPALEENRPVRLEGAIRLLGAIALRLSDGTDHLSRARLGGQAATLAAAVVFIATAGALGWAFR